jgi:pimeloyl-ACP methyl ester carboxylesterase
MASWRPTGAEGPRRLAAFLVALLLATSAVAETGSSPVPGTGRIKATLSGFSDDLPGALPKRNRPYATIPVLTLPDPATATVVIYSHGTTDSERPENCNVRGNAVPPSLRALTKAGVYIWYVCFERAMRTPKDNPGAFIYARMEEVSDAVRAFVALGVKPGRIFLAGHSAGGWTSLMLGREWGDEIGGIVAYAPAFARKRTDIARFPIWRKEVMPKQAAEMIRAGHLRALVIAYERDAFDRPQELRFLTEAYPDTVTLLSYTCDAEKDHMSHIEDCALDRSTAAVREFVLGAR